MYLKMKDGSNDEYISIGSIKIVIIGSDSLMIHHFRSDGQTKELPVRIHNVHDNDVLFKVIASSNKTDDVYTMAELIDKANKIYAENKPNISVEVDQIKPGITRSRTI